jgi:periplasmic protein TonB
MATQRTTIFIAVLAVHVVAAAAMLQQRQARTVTGEQTIEAFLIVDSPRPVAAATVPLALKAPVVELVAPEIQVTIATAPVLIPAEVPAAHPPAIAASTTSGESPLRVITPADYLRSPAPRYPPLARQLRQQGVVMVRVTIAATGEPMQVQIEKSSGFRLLDEAALDAVRKAWFRPMVESGTAHVAAALVPIEFLASALLASR